VPNGLERRRRYELGNGDPAAARGARAPASGRSVGPTSGRTSSRGVRGRTGCAQAALGLSRALIASWGANGGAVTARGRAREDGAGLYNRARGGGVCFLRVKVAKSR
jgi:hypothetical protein